MASGVLGVFGLLLAALYGFGITQIPQLRHGDPVGPRAFPLIILVLLVVASIMLILEWARTRRPRTARIDIRTVIGPHALHLTGVAALLLLYFLSFERAGYLLSTAVFLTVLATWIHTGRRWVAIVTALGFSVVSYLIFARLFEVPLPAGILPR